MKLIIKYAQLASFLVLAGLFTLILLLFSGFVFSQTIPGKSIKNVWNQHPELYSSPKVTWQDSVGPDYSLFYEGPSYKGRNTIVFAYYSVPLNVSEKIPAMVLVHGGGGKAYLNWTKQWADYGYAAIAMNLSGKDDTGNLIGRPRDDNNFDIHKDSIYDSWYYHTVAAILQAVSFLETRNEVDKERIGIMGISWGGFHTSALVGIDNRLSAAVIVYGCGELYKNSVWNREGYIFSDTYIHQLDPANFLPYAKIPILWMNNNTDHFFPLDSHQESRKMSKGKNYAWIRDNYSHGYEAPWQTEDIRRFADSFLKNGNASWPEISSAVLKDNFIRTKVKHSGKITEAWLVYTAEPDWMNKSVRKEGKDVWITKVATIDNYKLIVKAEIPHATVAAYLHMKDEQGREFSTDYFTIGSKTKNK